MILWKNKNFNEYGIVIEKIPTISKGKKDIETITIPGKSGFVSIDKGTYQPFVVSLECHAKEIGDFDLIRSFLDGYGTLSFDGEREYTAVIQNAIEFEKVSQFKKFPIEFLVNPIAEDITPTEYTVSSNSEMLEIDNATAIMYPILTITTSGECTISINDKGFQLLESGTYILDCKNKVITSNGTNASNKMNGDFIELSNQNNITYTGDITSFKITYKRSYL